ncbi:MAG: nucleotide pyrophosphohydrolase [Bdellovibrionota bacterium]|nr:MAG: nucleotide pyrophosphohydrolase [Bdellovibrionota bacterium]
MTNLEDLTARAIAFRDERNWKQFHNAKDAALSLVLEAAELLELFQWKNGAEIDQVVRTHHSALSDELADVLYWVLLLANDSGVDLRRAFEDKLAKNETKYPTEKARNRKEKYSQL